MHPLKSTPHILTLVALTETVLAKIDSLDSGEHFAYTDVVKGMVSNALL